MSSIYIYYSTPPTVHDSHLSQSTLSPQALSKDFAWVINSPPIIQGQRGNCNWTDNDFWMRAREEFPTHSNHNALMQIASELKDRRLGHYFETLLGYWFNSNERYQILASNLQIQELKKTIGELDFVVKDKQTGRIQHWEVACKFYLGIGNTNNINHWYGPMLKDRLANKYQQMQSRQSQLSEHPAARSILDGLSIQVDERICLMKGRLFYPLDQMIRQTPHSVAINHLRGWWSRPNEFLTREHFTQLRWYILNKKQWLSTRTLTKTCKTHTTNELIEIYRQEFGNRPVCVVGFAPDKYQEEVERGFLVPKDWANELNIIDNNAP